MTSPAAASTSTTTSGSRYGRSASSASIGLRMLPHCLQSAANSANSSGRAGARAADIPCCSICSSSTGLAVTPRSSDAPARRRPGDCPGPPHRTASEPAAAYRAASSPWRAATTSSCRRFLVRSPPRPPQWLPAARRQYFVGDRVIDRHAPEGDASRVPVSASRGGTRTAARRVSPCSVPSASARSVDTATIRPEGVATLGCPAQLSAEHVLGDRRLDLFKLLPTHVALMGVRDQRHHAARGLRRRWPWAPGRIARNLSVLP